MSRRALLLATASTGALAATGGVVTAAETGLLPGRIRLHSGLHLGEVTGTVPPGEPAALSRHSFASEKACKTVEWLAPRQLSFLGRQLAQ